MPTKKERAQYGALALLASARHTHGVQAGELPQDALSPDDHVDAVIDAIANLLHYARLQKMDVEPLLEVANMHFVAEEAEAK